MSLTYSPSTPRPRGLSRVQRQTYDLDSPQAAIQAQPGGDGTLESARLAIKALFLTIEKAQVVTAGAVRYCQGWFSRVAMAGMRVLFDPANGYDYYSGTNDLANTQIAKLGGFHLRQWQRVKKDLAALGVITYVHRSVKSGLESAPGVDQDIQISDLYYFTPSKLIPWLREAYDLTLARLKRERYAREAREAKEGKPPKRTPITKRERPKCRIPAMLNPVGWARSVAALAAAKAAPGAAYAAREAEAVAFASRLAMNALPG